MNHRKLSARPRIATIALIAAGLAAFAAPTVAQAAKEGRVKVMSRNIYLGADLTGAIAAPDSTQLALEAREIFNDVGFTQPNKRAKLQAREIAKAKPDLVGLQEVALWRGDFDGDGTEPFAPDGPVTPAEDVRFDFLEALMKELKREGAKYKVVRQQREFDAEIPLAGGNPGEGVPYDGRLTMRDVVLARKDAGVVTKHDFSERFKPEDSLQIEDIGGTPLDLTVWRGFIGLDAEVRGTKFRFVNTHLEAFDNDAKLAQAEALVAGLPEPGPANPESVARPVVLVGDLNSDDEIIETGSGVPGDELPYAAIVDAGLEERSYDGLNTDGNDELFSCCFDDELINVGPPAALEDIDHTVDHVMVSDDDHGDGVDPNSNDIELVKSVQTGNEPAAFARFGNWAADHLGVLSTLQFPTP